MSGQKRMLRDKRTSSVGSCNAKEDKSLHTYISAYLMPRPNFCDQLSKPHLLLSIVESSRVEKLLVCHPKTVQSCHIESLQLGVQLVHLPSTKDGGQLGGPEHVGGEHAAGGQQHHQGNIMA